MRFVLGEAILGRIARTMSHAWPMRSCAAKIEQSIVVSSPSPPSSRLQCHISLYGRWASKYTTDFSGIKAASAEYKNRPNQYRSRWLRPICPHYHLILTFYFRIGYIVFLWFYYNIKFYFKLSLPYFQSLMLLFLSRQPPSLSIFQFQI